MEKTNTRTLRKGKKKYQPPELHVITLTPEEVIKVATGGGGGKEHSCLESELTPC